MGHKLRQIAFEVCVYQKTMQIATRVRILVSLSFVMIVHIDVLKQSQKLETSTSSLIILLSGDHNVIQ